MVEKLQGEESNKQVFLITSGERKDTVETDEEWKDRDRKQGDPDFDFNIWFFLIPSHGTETVNADAYKDKFNTHLKPVKRQSFLQGIVQLQFTLNIAIFLLHIVTVGRVLTLNLNNQGIVTLLGITPTVIGQTSTEFLL